MIVFRTIRFSLCLLLLGNTFSPSLSGEEITLLDCEVRWRHQIVLSTDRPGLLTSVKFTQGDLVKEGDLVGTLDERVLQAQLAVAEKEAAGEIAIEAAQKAYLVGVAELDKAKEANLRLARVIPELEITRLKLRAEQGELEWKHRLYEQELKKLKVKELQATLQTTKIPSPISGMITKVEKSKGEAVRQGDPIVEITNLDLVRVEQNVPLELLPRLKRMQKAYAVVDGVRFEGHLHYIDVTVQPLAKKMLIWAELKNTNQKLRAGMKIDLVIQLDDTLVNLPGKKAN